MPELFKPDSEQKRGFLKREPQAVDMSDVREELRNIGSRVRILEERLTNLRTKAQVTEQNMLSKDKQLSQELKTTNLEVHELKRDLAELKEQLMLLMKELQSFAKKEELKILERYINMWEPVNFVTRNEVKDIVEDILKDK